MKEEPDKQMGEIQPQIGCTLCGGTGHYFVLVGGQTSLNEKRCECTRATRKRFSERLPVDKEVLDALTAIDTYDEAADGLFQACVTVATCEDLPMAVRLRAFHRMNECVGSDDPSTPETLAEFMQQCGM